MAMSVTYTTFCGHIVHEDRAGTERYYVRDPQGSTVAMTDMAGTVTDTWTYWPYGEVGNHTGMSVTGFTFLGTLAYLADYGSRYWVRARTVRADLARWATVDFIWPEHENAYVYANCMPQLSVDPSGLSPASMFWECFKKRIGLCFGGVLTCESCKRYSKAHYNCQNPIFSRIPRTRTTAPIQNGGSGSASDGNSNGSSCTDPSNPCIRMAGGWSSRFVRPGDADPHWAADCANCCEFVFDRSAKIPPFGSSWVTDCAWGCLEGKFSEADLTGFGIGITWDKAKQIWESL